MNRFLLIPFFVLSTFSLTGCGGEHATHEGQLVFKGQVTKVDYELPRGVTTFTDSEGKTHELEGHPGIPIAEVEIYKNGHEYEVFQAPRPQN